MNRSKGYYTLSGEPGHNYYDVIIVGAGPSGLFAGYELTRLARDAKVLIIEKGKDPAQRKLSSSVQGTRTADVLTAGAGGAGLFSDGKLVMNLDAGGHLGDYLSESKRKEILNLIEDVVRQMADKFTVRTISEDKVRTLRRVSTNYGMDFSCSRILHLGSHNLHTMIDAFTEHLGSRGVEFLFDTEVIGLKHCGESWAVSLNTSDIQDTVRAKYIILAVGKGESRWLAKLIADLGGMLGENGCWVGVRVEVPSRILNRLFDVTPDPKICTYFDRSRTEKIKTHCCCRNGEILELHYYGLPLLGGHTPYIEVDRQFDEKAFPNANFAILYKDSKKPYHWNDALTYMTSVKEAAGGKLLVQRLSDFVRGFATTPETLATNRIRPSNTSAIAGNVASVVPIEVRERLTMFIDRLNRLVPGINHADTLVYAPAIEWWMERINVDRNMEVCDVSGLFAVGDGAGLTQGIVQSAATGILAARAISSKVGSVALTELGVP